MRQGVCVDCGRTFYVLNDNGRVKERCEDCARKRRNEIDRKAYARWKERNKGGKVAPRMCAICGKNEVWTPKAKLCLECKEGRMDEQSRDVEKERAETKRYLSEIEKRKLFYAELKTEAAKAAKNFDKLCAKAKEAGMSYGKYQAMLRRQRIECGGTR